MGQKSNKIGLESKEKPRPQDTPSGHRRSPYRIDTSSPHLEFSVPKNALPARRSLSTAAGSSSFSRSLVSRPSLLFRAEEVLLALLFELGQSSQKNGAEEELELNLDRMGVVAYGKGTYFTQIFPVFLLSSTISWYLLGFSTQRSSRARSVFARGIPSPPGPPSRAHLEMDPQGSPQVADYRKHLPHNVCSSAGVMRGRRERGRYDTGAGTGQETKDRGRAKPEGASQQQRAV